MELGKKYFIENFGFYSEVAWIPKNCGGRSSTNIYFKKKSKIWLKTNI